MRFLATLGWIGAFCLGVSAQVPISQQSATDKSVAPSDKIDVTVLPAVPLPPPAGARPAYVPEQLLRMNECELIQVYKCGVVSPVPCGYTPGLVIYKPGSKITVAASKFMKFTAWQGKYIPGNGTMVNRQFGVPSIKATIYPGESYLDGGPTLVFDYKDTSLICNRYRDELREVSPGIFLGCMHRHGKDGSLEIATWFALDARCPKATCLPLKK